MIAIWSCDHISDVLLIHRIRNKICQVMLSLLQSDYIKRFLRYKQTDVGRIEDASHFFSSLSPSDQQACSPFWKKSFFVEKKNWLVDKKWLFPPSVPLWLMDFILALRFESVKTKKIVELCERIVLEGLKSSQCSLYLKMWWL